MDAISLIGNAKDAYAAGLRKQAAAGAEALQGVGRRGPSLSGGELDQKKVREAAQDFEGFFISQMMEHMMSGMEPNEIFGGGDAEETWRSLLNQEYGKQVAKSGKLGIANDVMTAMLRAQEERTTGGHGAPIPPAPAESTTNAAVQGTAAAIPARR
jgi:Rod binding domain-containing protein